MSASRDPVGIVVRFGDVEGSLVSYSSELAIGFELCGAGPGSCRLVAGRVDEDRVVLPVTASVESAPAHVRFCWGPSPVCNLSDGSGLPVGPFEVPID